MVTTQSEHTDRRILLIGLGRGGLDARIFKGFNQYRRGAVSWLLDDLGHYNEMLSEVMERNNPFKNVDGAMGHLLDAKLTGWLREAGIPAVDLSGSEAAKGALSVTVDGRAIGQMAAEHFERRHYASFLFVSNGLRHFEVERWRGFAEGVGLKAHRAEWCVLHQSAIDASQRRRYPEIRKENLKQFLQDLPKPLAVFTATDFTGGQVCRQARVMGLKVPSEVAVLGVDDFEMICESSDPPLSSISLPAERVGFEAARLLDRLMRGEAAEAPAPFSPTHVHTRASTELTAVEDSAVAKAVAFMRENIQEPIRMEEIAGHVHMHERTLLRHFQKAIGRSPNDELLRMRLEKAKELLRGDEMTVYEISHACGFGGPDMLGRHFKAETRLSPSEFRRLHKV